MPKVLKNGRWTQDRADAFDLALNGIHSDIFKNSDTFTVVLNGISYEKRKADLTLTELFSIITPASDWQEQLTIRNVADYDDLCEMFPGFPQLIERIGITPDQFSDERRNYAEKYREIMLGEIREHKTRQHSWGVVIAIGSLVTFASGILSLSFLVPLASVLTIFVGATNCLIHHDKKVELSESFTRSADPLQQVPTIKGISETLHTRVTEILSQHPELTFARLSEISNLTEIIGEEVELGESAHEQRLAVSQTVEQLEYALSNAKNLKASQKPENTLSASHSPHVQSAIRGAACINEMSSHAYKD